MPAVGVSALGMGAFLLRVVEVVLVEVGAGVGRLGAVAVLDTVLGRGLAMLGLVVVVAGLVFFSGLGRSFPDAVLAPLVATGLGAAFLAFSDLSSFFTSVPGFSVFSCFTSFSGSLVSTTASGFWTTSLPDSITLFSALSFSCFSPSLSFSALSFSVFSSSF